MKLPGWYEEKRVGRWDGRAWTTNDHMIVAVDKIDETAANVLAESTIARVMSDSVKTDARTVAEEAREHGFVIMGGRVFCAHLIDLVTALHPSATWKASGDKYDPAVAYVDGRIVGLVMGNRTSREDMAAEPGWPKCKECEGTGKRECKECEGSGEVVCECSHHGCEVEHDCSDCDGTGSLGQCATCGGDGRWREPAA